MEQKTMFCHLVRKFRWTASQEEVGISLGWERLTSQSDLGLAPELILKPINGVWIKFERI